MIKLNDDIFFWGRWGGGFIVAICSLSLFVQVGGKGDLNTLSIKKYIVVTKSICIVQNEYTVIYKLETYKNFAPLDTMH